MPRLVRRDALAPIRIDPPAPPQASAEPGAPLPPPPKPIWICACGLSQTFPICDGSHKVARIAEQPGQLYIYDRDNKTIIDSRPDEPPAGYPSAAT